MHGLLRCNINTGVRARVQRCHNSPDGKRTLASAEDMGRFWKSQLRWGEDGWLSLARGGLGLVSREMGGRWKSQNRKIVPLSPYVEKPLNSKVIKSFLLELRSRKCFSCLEIPMFYLCGHSMYVSHIAISWLWYSCICLWTIARSPVLFHSWQIFLKSSIYIWWFIFSCSPLYIS